MIVVDASAAIASLVNDGPARTALRTDRLHAPHLIDSEVTHALRRSSFLSPLDERRATSALQHWRTVALTRHPVHSLLTRMWDLRSNLSAYDAGYVALAEALGCSLVTADARLARADGIRCPVTLVPR